MAHSHDKILITDSSVNFMGTEIMVISKMLSILLYDRYDDTFFVLVKNNINK